VTTRPRILVPQPIQPEGLALLQEVGDVEVIDTDRMLSRDEMIAAIKRCDYMLAIGDQHLTSDILDANPDLKGIAFAAGHPGEWMDVDACTARGIPLTEISRGPVTETTAELTMALLLGCAWRLVEADAYTRAGKFRQEQSTLFMCHSLAGKTLGMVGLGAVGRLVAPRAKAFDLKLIYTKRTRLSPDDEAALGVEWVPDLDDVLRESDFVSLHAAATPETEKLIGRRELDLMKKTAFFINTARGRIVDEPELIAALRDKRIAGAGIDTFWHEPPVTEYPDPDPGFFKLDNVILTPHLGGATEESLSEIALQAARNLVAMVKGERPPNLCNPEVYDGANAVAG
jgi:glyoxylate reductase